MNDINTMQDAAVGTGTAPARTESTHLVAAAVMIPALARSLRSRTD